MPWHGYAGVPRGSGAAATAAAVAGRLEVLRHIKAAPGADGSSVCMILIALSEAVKYTPCATRNRHAKAVPVGIIALCRLCAKPGCVFRFWMRFKPFGRVIHLNGVNLGGENAIGLC